MSEHLSKRLKISNVVVAVILVIVPFHAFLTVWASTLVGHFEIIRLWDDTLLLILLIIVSTWLISSKELRKRLSANNLIRLIALYICLTLFIGLISYINKDVTLKALAYDVLVNLRFLLWFIAVWLVAIKSPWLSKNWQPLIFYSLLLVTIFGILQFFVLPHNFLSHFGYNRQKTFVPFITINQNSNTIRVQSFLRGANPLGAYLAMVISLLFASTLNKVKHQKQYLSLLVLSIITLILSFSRSAWIGAVFAVAAVTWLLLKTKNAKKLFIAAVCLVLVISSISILLLRNNHGVQDAFLHVSSSSTAKVTSNAGHESSIKSGLDDIIHDPLGLGPGTAGSASWYNAPHPIRNSESYFLEIGQEVGVLGLAMFIAINVFLGSELLKRRHNPLSLGLFAALIGIFIVSIFTYSWSDDTLAYIFWGLAAIALAEPAKHIKST